MLLGDGKCLAEGGGAGVGPAVEGGEGRGGARGGDRPGGEGRALAQRVVQGVLSAVHARALTADCRGVPEGGGQVAHPQRDLQMTAWLPLLRVLVQGKGEERLQLCIAVPPLVHDGPGGAAPAARTRGIFLAGRRHFDLKPQVSPGDSLL